MQFTGFIEALGSARSREEAFSLVCQIVASIGWKRAAFFAVTSEARQLLCGDDGISPVILSNYPEEYISNYTTNYLYSIDPVMLLAQQNITPLTRNEVEASMVLSDRQITLRSLRICAGITDEIVCPIHRSSTEIFALCYAREDYEDWDRSFLSAIQVISIHFYYTFTRLMQSLPESIPQSSGLSEKPAGTIEVPSLTQRERECLLWTARGKSASMVSVILGLSENTINFYVKNAMKKLGTTNRVIAVVLAVRSGLIQP